MAFDYHEAFSRNIGWVTEFEQEVLRNKRVAIAGLGGVGGSHLLTLTRLGIGAFNLADFDQFDIANFNRQAGATISHLGQPKLDVMAEMARDINPELDLRRYPEGVNSGNLDAFLDGVDLYVDSLDFFALEIRRRVFAACSERGIPAVTAAPLGMGAALLCFIPGKMSFEDYFRLEGQSEEEQALRFMLGLAPKPQHMSYLVDDSRINFRERRGPSTATACELCAGFAGTYALKILLNRGEVMAAPRGIHFDAYRNRLATTWLPLGNNNPVQRLRLSIARKRLAAAEMDSAGSAPALDTPIERVLDLGKWAPSGDNEQPWKFEIVAEDHAVIQTHDTREWCVYDLGGSSSQIAVGALLETIRIAASGEGKVAEITRREGTPEDALLFDVSLNDAPELTPSPLLPFVKSRVTQRRPFTRRPLSSAQKHALEQVVGEGYRVLWVEERGQVRKMAKLLFHNAHIRLTTPEAYVTHKQNIEWGVRFSEDRLPEYAVGVDYFTGKFMRWALGSWERVRFLNRFFAGTWLPRLQMDLATGVGCAAHFLIVSDRPMHTVDDYVAGGGAMQRFWLEATRQGLQFQPEMTPVIFSRYVASSTQFTGVESEQALAVKLAEELNRLIPGGDDPFRRVFMGRVGLGSSPTSRSIRPQLRDLMIERSE